MNSHVYSKTPLKDVLRVYNESTSRGFDGNSLVRTLDLLDKAIRGRGNIGKEMTDYGLYEMDQSWRM